MGFTTGKRACINIVCCNTIRISCDSRLRRRLLFSLVIPVHMCSRGHGLQKPCYMFAGLSANHVAMVSSPSRRNRSLARASPAIGAQSSKAACFQAHPAATGKRPCRTICHTAYTSLPPYSSETAIYTSRDCRVDSPVALVDIGPPLAVIAQSD